MVLRTLTCNPIPPSHLGRHQRVEADLLQAQDDIDIFTSLE